MNKIQIVVAVTMLLLTMFIMNAVVKNHLLEQPEVKYVDTHIAIDWKSFAIVVFLAFVMSAFIGGIYYDGIKP